MASKSFNSKYGFSVGTSPLELFDSSGSLTLPAGTTTLAPLKFVSGTNLTSPIAGVVEWNGVNLFITQTTGPTRKQIAYIDDNSTGTSALAISLAGGTTGSVHYQSAVGVTAFLAAGTASQVLISGASGPSWSNTPTLTGTNFSAIPNAALTNSSVTIGSTSVSLGATVTTFAGLVSVTSTTFVGALTGNATTATTATNIAGGLANGIPYQTAAGTTTFLAQGTGVLAETAGAPAWTTTPTLTGTNFSAIPNAALTNSSVTIGSTSVSLGATVTTFAGLVSVTSTTFVGALTGNATTATTATTATNVGGGTAGAIVYQTGSGATSFISAVASGSILASNGTSAVPVYTASPTLTTSLTVPLIQGTGSTGGAITIRAGTDTTGTINLNAAAINSSVASLTLYSTPATVAAYGAATTLSFGAATGTTTVNNNLAVTGNLTVNGALTTLTSNTLAIDDKNIELGKVTTVSGVTGTSSVGSAVVTGLSTTVGLIPGMVTTTTAGTLTLTGGTVILSVDSTTQVTLTNNFGGSGTATTLSFAGASDTTANGGGITLKGGTDKTLLWDNTNSNWTSSEHLNLVTGKVFKINNVSVLSATTLGSSVVGSSLTSVGTLTSLTTSGQITSTVATGTAPLVVASTTLVANLAAQTAVTGTNIAGGATGSLPYQSGAGATTFLTAGTSSQVLVGGASAPAWSNTPTLTGTNFTGIPNAGLLNSSVSLGAQTLTLGAAAITTITGMTSITSTTFVGALTGNASTVTTNANLTGPITSVGNATSVTNNAITNAMLAQMGAGTIKGNNTGSTANAIDLSVTQVTAMLNTFTSSLQGLVPSSGGGTANFLRADGTWTTPGGGGTVTSIADGSTNGVIWTVATRTSTPVFTFSLGAITPTSIVVDSTVTTGHATASAMVDQTIAQTSTGTVPVYKTVASNLTTTATTLVDLYVFAAASFRSAKFNVQAVDGTTGDVFFTEVMVTKDNSNNIYFSEWGAVWSGSQIIALSADYDGTTNVRLRVTPATTHSTVMKVAGTVFYL